MNREDERDNYDIHGNDVRTSIEGDYSEEISTKGRMITPPSSEDEEEDAILMGEVEDMR